MAIWSRIRRRLTRDRAGRHLAERDAPAEPGTARTRATGGVHKPGAPTGKPRQTDDEEESRPD